VWGVGCGVWGGDGQQAHLLKNRKSDSMQEST
jgi:hypothetical protein